MHRHPIILAALEKNGSGILNSIDLPNNTYLLEEGHSYSDIMPLYTQSGFAVPNEFRHKWSLTVGDSAKLLPTLIKQLGMIDFFFHDSAHTYDMMMFEFDTVWSNLRSGGLLVSDDASWNDAFVDFAKKKDVPCQSYQTKGLIIKP